MPAPSLPTTSATRPVGARFVEDRPRGLLVEPDRGEAGVLEPVDRAREVRDPRVGEVQQGARGRADRRRGRRAPTRCVRVTSIARPGGLDRPRGRAEVLRVLDAVEHHDDRVRRPPRSDSSRSPSVRGVRHGSIAPPRRGDRRRAGRGRARSTSADAHLCATERRRRRRASPGSAGRPRDQHLVGDTGRAPPRAPRACPRRRLRSTRYAITAIARQPTPSPASPSPSGRVALTDTRSTPQPQARGELVAHLGATRIDRRAVADHGGVDRRRQVPRQRHLRDDVTQERSPLDVLGVGGRIGEMLTEVAERGRPEQRVGDRMTHHVAVGMADQAVLAFEPHTAEPQRPVLREPMHVEPEPAARLRHRRRRSAPPRARGRASS